MMDYTLLLDIMIVIFLTWNSIDIHRIKKENKIIKRIQNGEDVEEQSY